MAFEISNPYKGLKVPFVRRPTVKGVKVLKDGWTTVTADGKLSAHFEHSVAITENGPVILTLPD